MKEQDVERLVVCNSVTEAIEALQVIVTIDDQVDTETMAGN